MQPEKIVLKFGTNSLTKDGKLDYSVIERIAKVTCGLYNDGKLPVIVTSGAVAAGMDLNGLKERPKYTELLQILSGEGARVLWDAYATAFAPYGLGTIYLPLTYHSFAAEHAKENIKRLVEFAGEKKKIIIGNTHDMLTSEQLVKAEDHPLGFYDNDPMAVLLACAIEAKRIVFFTDNGKMGTGGAYSKTKAIEGAKEAGIKVDVKGIKELETLL
jgi:glutamate 5-kinase